MSRTSSAHLDRLNVLVMLGLLGLSTGLAASVQLDSRQAQNLWLAAFCVLLAPWLVVRKDQDQVAITVVLAAAGLTIAADTFNFEATWIQTAALSAVGAAVALQTIRKDRHVLVPGSAVALVMLLTLRSLFDTHVVPPALEFSAGAMAAVAAAAAIAHFDVRCPTSWPPSLCLIVASVSAAFVGIDGEHLGTTIVILAVGTSELIDALKPPAPQAPLPIVPVPQRASVLWALVGSGTGIAALAVATTRNSVLMWSLAGAIMVGLAGLGLLAFEWQAANSQRLRQLQQAARESRTDALTGVVNRRGVDERLGDEFARARRFDHPLTLLLIDLDDFKAINDRHGHAAGDRALRVTARLIQQSTRAIDTTGRFGGEEFLVILPETTTTGAQVVAERIRSSVERSGPATVSIGVASLDATVHVGSELVARADTALYHAKRTGKNRIALAA